MEEINIAIFAFDGERKLRLREPRGPTAPRETRRAHPGRDAASSGSPNASRATRRACSRSHFPAASALGHAPREFREGGRPHQLVVIADLSRTLREEELLAWQRIVRVLGHELNNSLAPSSRSPAASARCCGVDPRADWEADMARGLDIIVRRRRKPRAAHAGLRGLARLPQPTLAPCASRRSCSGRRARDAFLVKMLPSPDTTLMSPPNPARGSDSAATC